jgi:hypothetical protein
MSVVLDGVRDVMARIQENIESSQAVIGSYHKVLAEQDGVQILERVPVDYGDEEFDGTAIIHLFLNRRDVHILLSQLHRSRIPI